MYSGSPYFSERARRSSCSSENWRTGAGLNTLAIAEELATQYRLAGSSEDGMESVNGTVIAFLHDTVGRANGVVLDGGEEIRCSPAQLDLIAPIVTLGSRIEIGGDVQYCKDEQRILSAAHITNLESKRTTSLPAPVCLGKPGMLSHVTPTTRASLAHLPSKGDESLAVEPAAIEDSLSAVDLALKKITGRPRERQGRTTNENSQRESTAILRATRSDAVEEIERAYDGLHRIQAILAYLNIIGRQVHGISQMHEEAKHTYEQAMSRHGMLDFEGAREFASASGCLSRVIEGAICRTLRSDSGFPSTVTPPPEHAGTCGSSSRVEEDLELVEGVLSRVHWLLENGTLPADDRAQVRKITVWSDAFYHQARRSYEHGAHRDAAELAQAAVYTAHSAEHVCRNWYLAHAMSSPDGVISGVPSPQP